MRSSFFEYNVASSALFTARGALDVVSHNLANSSIKGYSKQFAKMRATPALSFRNGRGMIGTGSEVYGTGQLRDFYLDRKYWSERGALGTYQARKDSLKVIESTLNDLGGSGIKTSFLNFQNTLQDLSRNADDPTYRNNAIQFANSLVTNINSSAQSLRKQQLDLNNELDSTVKMINNLGERIASLNRQISSAELDGSSANDLRDERMRLVDDLSLLVNVEVSETDYSTSNKPNDKRFSIMINGYDFVNHFDMNSLKTTVRTTKLNDMDADGLLDVEFTNGTKFDLNHPALKGQLKGIVDVRDGNSMVTAHATKGVNYKGIPYYLEKLNTLVRTFADAMNKEHLKGVDGHGNQSNNTLFFTYTGNAAIPPNYANMDAFNFKLNPDLLEDPMKLACAYYQPAQDGVSVSKNNLITDGFLRDVFNNKSLFKEGRVDDFLASVTGELSIDAKQANKFQENYTDLSTQIDNQRLAVSGVDPNEEMADMIKFQHLYMAAGKLMNVIDSIYDFTINQLGRG